MKKWHITTASVTISIIITTTLLLTNYFMLQSDTEAIGAVATQSEQCAIIGADIMKRGGSAADSLLATAFCVDLKEPHSTGIGAGFVLSIYDEPTKKVKVLNAAPCAPGAVKEDMLANLTFGMINGSLVPVMLKGYIVLYTKYGRLPWADLIQPALDICRKGIKVTASLSAALEMYRFRIYGNEGLKKVLIDDDLMDVYSAGQVFRNEKYCETLEIIQKIDLEEGLKGQDTFTRKLAGELNSMGSMITLEDFEKCPVEWVDAVTLPFPNDRTFHTAPPPSAGIVIGYMFNLFNSKPLSKNDYDDSIVVWQRIVESEKFGFGQRTKVADPRFDKDVEKFLKYITSAEAIAEASVKMLDNMTSYNYSYYGADGGRFMQRGPGILGGGTEQINIYSPEGYAISFCSGYSTHFGSGVLLPNLGVIMNGDMKHFKPPAESSGYPRLKNLPIEPYKRLVTSKSPIIITGDDLDVELVVGSSGGYRSQSAIFQVLMRYFIHQMPLQNAIDALRLHHQLFPMKIAFELKFHTEKPYLVRQLASLGHYYDLHTLSEMACVLVISQFSGSVEGFTDPRKTGEVAYIYP